MTAVRIRHWEELGRDELYALLALRSAVFVVEQRSIYLDPDGIDPRSLHVLLDPGGGLAAAGRVYEGEGGWHLGRVVVRAPERGRGHGRAIVGTALDLVSPAPLLIEAQAHLEGYYVALGFRRRGEPYVLDGIPHIPMVHPGRRGTAPRPA
jgi:ElaA protein